MRRQLVGITVMFFAGIVLDYYLDYGQILFILVTAAVCIFLFGNSWAERRKTEIGCKGKNVRKMKSGRHTEPVGQGGDCNCSAKVQILGRKTLKIYAAVAVAGILVMELATYGIAHDSLRAKVGERCQLRGQVLSVEQKEEDKYRILMEIEGSRILCNYYKPLENCNGLIGRYIAFEGVPEEPKTAGTPRGFDYNLYLKTKKILYVTQTSYFHLLDREPGAVMRCKAYILSKRDEMLEVLNLREETYALVKGIVFGDTNQLDEDIYEDFRKNGTAHILAVSGLHIGMLYAAYRALMRKVNSKYITVAFFLLLIVYGTATAWTVSVSRAVLLIFVVTVGDLLDRRYDLLTALALVAFVLAVDNPYVIFGAGFQMSFLAVSSIAFIAPFLERYVSPSVAGLMAVQLGLMPYSIYTFNQVSLIGILINIPVVFITSVLVPVGVASYFLYLGLNCVFMPSSAILEGLSTVVLKINHIVASLDFLSVDVPSMPLWVLVLIYGLTFFLTSEFFYIYMRRKQYRLIGVSLCVIMCVCFFFGIADSSPFDRADLVFVDVGQGDCLQIKQSRHRSILIDGGGNVNYDVGKKILKPYLMRNGQGSLQLAAATHLHTDHYLGLYQLAQCFPVKKLLTEGQANDKIKVSDNIYIDVLWPEKRDETIDDENLNSMIFKVHINGISVLVTGDITEEGEQLLLKKYGKGDTLKADILKVAHHGSPYSSCRTFLEAVSPSVAVISVGKNNYGHPSEDVIRRLNAGGCRVYRTDINGSVGIRCNKGKISICTMRKNNIY